MPGTDRLRVDAVADAAGVGQAEQLCGGASGLQRGRVDRGADVRRHELVRLPLAGRARSRSSTLAMARSTPGSMPVIAPGLERERDQPGRRVGQQRMGWSPSFSRVPATAHAVAQC